MTRLLTRIAALVAAAGLCGVAQAAPPAWDMTLQWSPQVCKERAGNREPQCLDPHFFVISRLASSGARSGACSQAEIPSALVDQAMLDVQNRPQVLRMWFEDGACTPLSPREYFVQVSRAARRWATPAAFQELEKGAAYSRQDLRAAMLAANPDLKPEAFTLECSGRYLRRWRICMDANFDAAACAADAEDACPDQVRVRAPAGQRD